MLSFTSTLLQNASASRAFTILELVVVIGLLTMLGSMFALNTGTARDQARLDAATRELQSLLREAQTLGRTGRAATHAACTATYDCGYGVYIEDTGSGSLVARMYAGQGGGDSTVQVDNQYENETNTPTERTLDLSAFTGVIKVEDSGGNVSVESEVYMHFRRGLLGVVISESGTLDHVRTSISLTTDSGLSHTVVVNQAGLIYVE